MKFLPDNTYHVYNQGNNQQNIFINDADFLLFLKLYTSCIVPYCETLAWCLMHNHFHFMVYADDRVNALQKQGGLLLDPVTNGFRKLLSKYAQEFNKTNNRTGSLFRPKTKTICLNDDYKLQANTLSSQDYFRNTFNYIHFNAVEAGIADHPSKWKWSSYNFYAGIRQQSICNKSLAEKICGPFYT